MSATGSNRVASDRVSARLVVLDDEAAHMRALCDTLREQGYEVSGFATPGEALAAVQPGRFDLLLVDLMMPEMDGISVLKRAAEVDPDIASVVMTGQGTIETAVRAMKAGALDYILKPFKLSAILPVLARALSIRQLRVENRELNRRVREHALELEEANKELESFSYSISHDLRAPLRAIEGFNGLVLKRFSAELPPDALKLLTQVDRNAKRMSQLIDDLLRFSRLGRQPLQKQRIDVQKLVNEVVESLRLEAAQRDVEVRLGELPAIRADLPLFRQVFVNLLSNAFKFTRNNSKTIIEVGSRNGAGEVIFFVRDNGAGFDMNYAQKLFKVFQRLHSEDEFEGTGVGLSIAHRIVHRHGGRIWAESQLNKGATFYVAMPAEPAHD
ncbi:MAG TPA: response regulator [Verrucomicrobia bacterium]|nr:response regulator [Verrucomicrobiota bacterium]HOP96511.1 response regulator [Verrucomicrobiota bacterium]